MKFRKPYGNVNLPDKVTGNINPNYTPSRDDDNGDVDCGHIKFNPLLWEKAPAVMSSNVHPR